MRRFACGSGRPSSECLVGEGRIRSSQRESSRWAKVMTHLMFGILALTRTRSYDAPGRAAGELRGSRLSAESKTKNPDLTKDSSCQGVSADDSSMRENRTCNE